MTRPKVLVCAVLMALGAGLALAEDATGKWTGQISGPDGDTTLTFNLKQDGGNLTGTVEGPAGELQIQNGKVEGDKVSFLVSFDAGNGEMKIMHEGTIKGDEMTLNVKVEGGEGGEGGPGPITLKRVK